MRKLLPILLITALVSCNSCGDDVTPPTPDTLPPPPPRVQAPAFSPDSAYAFIQAQVDLGPRVPGTEAHEKCADMLKKKLGVYLDTVTVQEGTVTTYDGKQLRIKNIMGSYKPERKDRVLLFAHWDTRHIADRDSVDKNKPFDGANDGGSGVGVLLEVARVLQQQDPNIGVDILFLDAEDYGQPSDVKDGEEKNDTWCLGAQYWASHKPPGYSPRWGILLDMVGAKDPMFPREGTSMEYAPALVDKVWQSAAQLGYGSIFLNDPTPPTVDDHYYINGVAQIPSIDIVHYDPIKRDYFAHHHRHSDNMENIDKNTLNAVGRVLLDVVYNENPPK